MTEHLIALGLAVATGIMIGAAVAGAVLLEHSIYWTVFLRLPAALHADLRRAARGNLVSVHTEVLDRLLASFERERRP